MTAPFDDENEPGMLEGILRKIPGFAGYLDKDERRKSDEQARRLVADHLDRAKRSLDSFTSSLVDQGKIDVLPKFDRLRGRTDHLIAQLRSAPAGYTDFFESSLVDDEILEDVYEHDLWTVDEAEKLAQEIEALAQQRPDPEQVLSDVNTRLDQFEDRVRRRQELLAQLGKPE